MSGWIRLQCCCGAKWNWYGRESEGAALERLWRKSHLGSGHVVTILQAWRRAA
jgi:hypothetical protein